MHRVDVALYCNGANAAVYCSATLFGMRWRERRGLERKRKKWNGCQGWYRLSNGGYFLSSAW